MQRIGDETAFDSAVVGLLVSEPLRIRRPPESFVPIHFLLRDEFRHAVLKRFRCAGGQGDIAFRFKIDDVELAASNGCNRAAIRRKMRDQSSFGPEVRSRVESARVMTYNLLESETSNLLPSFDN